MTIVEPQVQNILITLTQQYGDFRTKQEYGISAFWYWYYQAKEYIYNLHSLNIRYGSQRTHKILQWGKLTYSKYTIGKDTFVVVHKFDYNQRKLWNWLNHKSNRNPSYSVCDNCFGYRSVLYDNSQKYGILKPDGKALIRPIFDDIINFHHSSNDYNTLHAIGFINDRVYEIATDGNVTLLHMSKEDYLNATHKFFESVHRQKIIENKQYNTMKDTNKVRLTENQLHTIIKESIKKMLTESGDTQRGQFMLGRLSSKRNGSDDDFKRRVGYDAYKTATPKGGLPSDAFQRGEQYQNQIDNTSDLFKRSNAYRQAQFQYDAYKMNDMDKLGQKFINFIEKYDGGVLLQTIVDYESGNQTGKPCSPLQELISEFEDNVLGYDCTSEMKKAIKAAYNQWWVYAYDQLMPQELLDESKSINRIKLTESQLHSVIKKCVNEAYRLYNQYGMPSGDENTNIFDDSDDQIPSLTKDDRLGDKNWKEYEREEYLKKNPHMRNYVGLDISKCKPIDLQRAYDMARYGTAYADTRPLILHNELEESIRRAIRKVLR